jgi:menaquinone-dependent protoporphyrinogen oxidase
LSSELFGGVYDPAKLRFPDTLLAKLPVSPLHDAPASDVRDWEAIRLWATQLAALFEKESAV